MTSSIGKRVEKLEKTVIPDEPEVIIGYTKDEIDKKLEEFRTKYPHAPTPIIVQLDHRVDKQKNEGEGEKI
ncbi:MAG: hypothetical protein C4522_22090 [Desulfobacteraceae bacterium]|nr:MAG: hypothetical protein C4522_22090 [Desulfobacteraceae bacterium]